MHYDLGSRIGAVECLCGITVIVAVGRPGRAAFLITRAAAETEGEMLARTAEKPERQYYRFRAPELPRLPILHYGIGA
jgi:hypothetical protein